MIVVSDTSCISNLLTIGIPIIGLVGVLVTAKRAGLLESIGPVLRQLEVDAGFCLSASLEDEVLRAVGET